VTRARPLRAFLRVESASARVLVTAVVVALAWVNITHAQLATEAAEAAGAQGKFWQMHDPVPRPVSYGTRTPHA
jgi:hypothetical protein